MSSATEFKGFRGVWTALITPFNESGELDLAAFRKLLDDQAQAGISGVIPCGTTGESPTLSTEEKKTLIRTALEHLKGSKTRVIAGTGGNNTAEAIELSRWASDQGVAGVLVVTPYYNKPSQAGMSAHFRAVADTVSCDVMLYNVPGRTGVSLAAPTVAELAAHPRITALKEATGNVALTSEIRDCLRLAGQSLDILSGDDATYFPLLAVGASGVVSVASNLFPRGMVAIQNAVEMGDLKQARELHERYYPLFRDLFIDSNPVPVKHAMAALGRCANQLRLPLVPLSASNAEKLMASVERCGIRKGQPA